MLKKVKVFSQMIQIDFLFLAGIKFGETWSSLTAMMPVVFKKCDLECPYIYNKEFKTVKALLD